MAECFVNGGGGALIETGSYVGTGVYGSSNRTSLTVSFPPKYLIIQKTSGSYYLTGFGVTHDSPNEIYGVGFPLAPFKEGGVSYLITRWAGNTIYHVTVSISGDGRTISWYSTSSSEAQLNDADTRYYYTAFG